MSRFRLGLFVAVGVSLFTTLMVALTRRKKLRQELDKRFEVLRNARLSREQLKQSARQTGTQVRKTRKVLGHLLRQSARRMMQRRHKGGNLAELPA